MIFPGDWHILLTFQKVLMKIYYSAGLKQLAIEAGYRAETLTSLGKCSNFKRTHNFLLQSWQAMYMKIITCFCTHEPAFLTDTHVDEIVLSNSGQDTLTTLEPLTTNAFNMFTERLSNQDDTWKFWCQFLLNDCMCYMYITLYIAVRCKNWMLRVSALKMMAPLFAACDRTTYQQLVPHHLADIQTFPDFVINSFKEGGFAACITGGKECAVAFDEAHEMRINKDMKSAVVHIKSISTKNVLISSILHNSL